MLEDNYAIGKENYKNLNFNQALNNFNKALEKDPNNIDYLYALARTYSIIYDSERNSRESLKFYNKILDLEPLHSKALLGKSLLLANLGQVTNAKNIIVNGIYKSNNGNLWAMKGLLYSYIHDKDSEIEFCFNKAFELSGDIAYICYLRARTYENDLEYKNAIKYFDKSLGGLNNESLSDLDEGVYVNKSFILLRKGWMYIKTNELNKALECFEDILEINKKSISGLYSKAYIYCLEDDLESALNVLGVALYLDPHDIPSLILKGIIYGVQGSPKMAMGIYQHILDFDESNELALMNMSGILFYQKEYQKSFDIAKKALEMEPYHAFALYYGSAAANKIGNMELAKKWKKKLSNPRVNQIFLEKNLQDKIVDEPWRLKKAGFDLSFYAREYTLIDRPGRLDLLYKDVKTDDYVVVELKVVPADKDVYKQIKNYMDSISQTIGFVRKVKGLIISFGYNEEFKNLIDKDPNVSQINYDKLGLA